MKHPTLLSLITVINVFRLHESSQSTPNGEEISIFIRDTTDTQQQLIPIELHASATLEHLKTQIGITANVSAPFWNVSLFHQSIQIPFVSGTPLADTGVSSETVIDYTIHVLHPLTAKIMPKLQIHNDLVAPHYMNITLPPREIATVKHLKQTIATAFHIPLENIQIQLFPEFGYKLINDEAKLSKHYQCTQHSVINSIFYDIHIQQMDMFVDVDIGDRNYKNIHCKVNVSSKIRRDYDFFADLRTQIQNYVRYDDDAPIVFDIITSNNSRYFRDYTPQNSYVYVIGENVRTMLFRSPIQHRRHWNLMAADRITHVHRSKLGQIEYNSIRENVVWSFEILAKNSESIRIYDRNPKKVDHSAAVFATIHFYIVLMSMDVSDEKKGCCSAM